jgi:hypothetical protein
MPVARPTNEEKRKRDYQVMKHVDEGFDHHQIAEIVGMRPQNVLGLPAYRVAQGEAVEGFKVVSPRDQKLRLEELTERAMIDLDKIDTLIKRLSTNPTKHALRMEKLYQIKLKYYTAISEMWAITQTILGEGTGPTKTGDKTQININYKKIDEAANKAAEVLDKARLNGELGNAS